jgi:hypothetical protein
MIEQRATYYAERFDQATSQLAVERREHRLTKKYLCAYRWIACTGWAIAIMSLLGWLPC